MGPKGSEGSVGSRCNHGCQDVRHPEIPSHVSSPETGLSFLSVIHNRLSGGLNQLYLYIMYQ